MQRRGFDSDSRWASRTGAGVCASGIPAVTADPKHHEECEDDKARGMEFHLERSSTTRTERIAIFWLWVSARCKKGP